MAGIKGRSGPLGNSNAVRHGSYARERALKGHRWDRRTRTYRQVEARMREYSKALGGRVSPQKAFLLREAAVLEHVLIEPMDVYLSGLKSPIRKGKVNPAVEIRLKLSVHVRDLLELAGWERVKRAPRPLFG